METTKYNYKPFTTYDPMVNMPMNFVDQFQHASNHAIWDLVEHLSSSLKHQKFMGRYRLDHHLVSQKSDKVSWQIAWLVGDAS